MFKLDSLTKIILSNGIWWRTPLKCTLWYRIQASWPPIKLTAALESQNLCMYYLANVSVVETNSWMKLITALFAWPLCEGVNPTLVISWKKTDIFYLCSNVNELVLLKLGRLIPSVGLSRFVLWQLHWPSLWVNRSVCQEKKCDKVLP